MGQKCRKYSKARKNGLIPNPRKAKEEAQHKNSNAFREKCRTVVKGRPKEQAADNEKA